MIDKSHRPHSKHPNAHTDEEIKWIKDLIRRNPHITLCELWIKLKRNKGYKRHIVSLYRVLKRIGFYNQVLISGTSKYTPKKYDTPTELGKKWQIDVKYVPNECKTNSLPEEIQTDNGTEFTYNREKIKVLHPMDEFCINNNIYHHKIRPRTPRHNGKVERSHRNDNERFYSFLNFYSLEDLIKQGTQYLKRSNNIPMQVLNYLTPIEMRQKLLNK